MTGNNMVPGKGSDDEGEIMMKKKRYGRKQGVKAEMHEINFIF